MKILRYSTVFFLSVWILTCYSQGILANNPKQEIRSQDTKNELLPRDTVMKAITVRSGEEQTVKINGTVTVAGKDQEVAVEKEGSVTITAGEKIIMLPGTKVDAGGSLYASIETTPRIHIKKRQATLPVEIAEQVKEEEKQKEKATLVQAYDLFSPFVTPAKGSLTNADSTGEQFTISGSESSGIACEQQRRVAAGPGTAYQVSSHPITSKSSVCQITSGFKPVVIMALRL